MNRTDKDYAEDLNKNGIRPSIQRIAIYKYIQEQPVHPTVDKVFTSLNKLYPTLSRTTVYNTLKTFAQCGLINSV